MPIKLDFNNRTGSSVEIIADPFGFPMFKTGGMDFYMHLWPVSKVQFERFIYETNTPGYSDGWYDSVLSLNPRITARKINRDNYEGAFITGITPPDAAAFSRRIGDDFEIPEGSRWREAFGELESLAEKGLNLPAGLNEQAKIMAEKLARISTNILDFTLMKNGLVEWVMSGGRYLGLGSPRASFHENVYDPMMDYWKPFNINSPMSFFGFRLIRP